MKIAKFRRYKFYILMGLIILLYMYSIMKDSEWYYRVWDAEVRLGDKVLKNARLYSTNNGKYLLLTSRPETANNALVLWSHAKRVGYANIGGLVEFPRFVFSRLPVGVVELDGSSGKAEFFDAEPKFEKNSIQFKLPPYLLLQPDLKMNRLSDRNANLLRITLRKVNAE